MRSTAIRLATSPAACPPSPSATATRRSVTSTLSSFVLRTRPGWVTADDAMFSNSTSSVPARPVLASRLTSVRGDAPWALLPMIRYRSARRPVPATPMRGGRAQNHPGERHDLRTGHRRPDPHPGRHRRVGHLAARRRLRRRAGPPAGLAPDRPLRDADLGPGQPDRRHRGRDAADPAGDRRPAARPRRDRGPPRRDRRRIRAPARQSRTASCWPSPTSDGSTRWSSGPPPSRVGASSARWPGGWCATPPGRSRSSPEQIRCFRAPRTRVKLA